MLASFFNRIRNLPSHQKGMIAAEFAMLLPILVLLCFGMIEVARYIQFNQKMDAGTSQMVHIINQNLNLSLADLNIVMDATAEIIRPFDGQNLTICISAVQQNDPTPNSAADVMWQVGRNMGANISRIAPEGPNSTIFLPNIQLNHREQIIVVELFNKYQPLLENGITERLANSIADVSYKWFIGRPRYGSFQFAPQ